MQPIIMHNSKQKRDAKTASQLFTRSQLQTCNSELFYDDFLSFYFVAEQAEDVDL